MTAKANKTAVIGMTMFTTTKAIATETERLKRVGVSYQVDLHVLACSVLAHLGKNGNIGIVTQFIEAVPDVVRVNALKDWFEAFSKCTFIGADGKVMKTPAYAKGKAQRLGEAMEKPFWKFKANEGAPYKPLVMQDYLGQQITKLEKDAKETKADHTLLIAAFKAEQNRLATVN
jgi:hypothetical protein